RLRTRGLHHRANPCDYPATDQSRFPQRESRRNLHHRRLWHGRKTTERGDPSVVPDGLTAAIAKTSLTIGHQAGETHRGAHVAQGRPTIQAILTATAGRPPDGDD